MTETYCGKSCGAYRQEELLNCPGCKEGPGRQLSGACELARCARGRHHESCDTCKHNSSCGTWERRFQMADQWKKKLQQKEELAQWTPTMVKWFQILFWLIVPGTIAGLVADETLARLLPGLYIPGQILGVLTTAVYGLVLLKLSTEEDQYRIPGICNLVSCGVSVLLILCAGIPDSSAGATFFVTGAGIVSIIGEWLECDAHRNILPPQLDQLEQHPGNLHCAYCGGDWSRDGKVHETGLSLPDGQGFRYLSQEQIIQSHYPLP